MSLWKPFLFKPPQRQEQILTRCGEMGPLSTACVKCVTGKAVHLEQNLESHKVDQNYKMVEALSIPSSTPKRRKFKFTQKPAHLSLTSLLVTTVDIAQKAVN